MPKYYYNYGFIKELLITKVDFLSEKEAINSSLILNVL